MKISRAKKYWIIIATAWALFSLSAGILWWCLLGMYSHKKTNALTIKKMKNILQIVNADFDIVGADKIKFEEGRPYIIMSNHRSHYDIPLIFAAFPRQTVRMIAKKELFRIPVWGGAMRASGCISIDREDRHQAVKDLQNAKEKMLSGVIIWIAPEGTRSRTGKLGKFKKGGFKLAMQVGAKIIPVCIIGSEKILPPETLDFSVGEKIKIYIADPIDSANYEDAGKLILDVESAVRRAGSLSADD
jgi:1-acyl-sn-glycerol-3-phosphate acyltransferase